MPNIEANLKSDEFIQLANKFDMRFGVRRTNVAQKKRNQDQQAGL